MLKHFGAGDGSEWCHSPGLASGSGIELHSCVDIAEISDRIFETFEVRPDKSVRANETQQNWMLHVNRLQISRGVADLFNLSTTLR